MTEAVEALTRGGRSGVLQLPRKSNHFQVLPAYFEKSLLRDKINANPFNAAMAVSYLKLFHRMIEKEMTNSQLKNRAGFSSNIMTRFKRNGYVSFKSVVGEHGKYLPPHGLRRDDILEFVSEDNGGNTNGK